MCRLFSVNYCLLSAKWTIMCEIISCSIRDRIRNACAFCLPLKCSEDLSSFGLWHQIDCWLHRWTKCFANWMRYRPASVVDVASSSIESRHLWMWAPMWMPDLMSLPPHDSMHSIRILHLGHHSLLWVAADINSIRVSRDCLSGAKECREKWNDKSHEIAYLFHNFVQMICCRWIPSRRFDSIALRAWLVAHTKLYCINRSSTVLVRTRRTKFSIRFNFVSFFSLFFPFFHCVATLCCFVFVLLTNNFRILFFSLAYWLSTEHNNRINYHLCMCRSCAILCAARWRQRRQWR